ncbi:MAG: hypothetical protein ACOX9E_10470, partial [Lentisphaeria bacterium]
MKLTARIVGTRNEKRSNHNRGKAAEIIQKHKMLLLGDFWACQGRIFGYFSRSPLNSSPPTLGGPHSNKVARARKRLRQAGGPHSLYGAYETRRLVSHMTGRRRTASFLQIVPGIFPTGVVIPIKNQTDLNNLGYPDLPLYGRCGVPHTKHGACNEQTRTSR